VVKDVKYSDLRAAIPRTVYFPALQSKDPHSWSTYYIRMASGDPLRTVHSAGEVLRQIDPVLRLTEPQRLTDTVNRSILNERLLTMLSSFFGLIALALASIGIFGIMAFQVARRRHEFGIRIALGADRRSVLRTVLAEVCVMLSAGIAAGLIAAALVTGFARNLLFELTPTDPASFVCAAIVLTFAALAAGYLPALRASRIDPMEALRSD
jgi:ABC-type antimicrobial peptide transport system permease subunit